ncbi:MAG: response regulator [Proteobacteria bacterium]|nr:response regulator [Pseudomonadota bacterium]
MNKDKGIHILIIDDNEDDILILMRHLQSYEEPVEVTSVRSGEEAIQRMKANRYDLCLLDLNLPAISGLELLQHILSHEDNLPSIVITGQGDENSAVQAMKLGAYDYIVKDEISQSLLNKTIHHALEAHMNKIEKGKLEEELQAYTERLEAMVMERTKEINYLNNYKDLILGSLDDYIRVVDPVKEIIQYESKKVRDELGSNAGKDCFMFWDREDPCENCISKLAIKEWRVKTREETSNSKIFRVTAIPLRNLDGTESVIEVIRDITEHRRMNEELKQKKKLAAMGEMSAYLAHEIRGPLNALGLAYEFLNESNDVKGEDREALENLGRGLETLFTLATDLLDYSRSDNLNLQSVEPINVINNVIYEIKQKLSDKNVKVETHLPEHLPSMNLDTLKIRQVFLNVINNAIHSMDEEGLLTLSAKAENGFLNISISDTGCGMTEEELDNIFLPFYTAKRGGTGLGMAIVKHFLALHGGHIKIASEKGKGTTVILFLPFLNKDDEDK